MNNAPQRATLNQSLELDTMLRSHGHRATAPRRAVWEALTRARSHLTAEQLTERARSNDEGINRASVYRSLTLFAELGIARETSLGAEAGAARWELAHPDDQFHLVCSSCGAVEHHTGDLVEQIRHHLGGDHGFSADHIELSVTGTCRECSGLAP